MSPADSGTPKTLGYIARLHVALALPCETRVVSRSPELRFVRDLEILIHRIGMTLQNFILGGWRWSCRLRISLTERNHVAGTRVD